VTVNGAENPTSSDALNSFRYYRDRLVGNGAHADSVFRAGSSVQIRPWTRDLVVGAM